MAAQNLTDNHITNAVVNTDNHVSRDYIQVVNQRIINNATTKNNSHTNICFGLTESVKYFCGRNGEIHELHKAFESNKIIVIQGLGGIGKSELVRKYAWLYKKQEGNFIFNYLLSWYYNLYDNILWIKSGNSQVLKASFEMLAAKLDIEIKNKQLTDIIMEIYEYIIGFTLIIFDNVDSVMEVRKYFPPERNTNFKLLITSQLSEWGDIKFINLEVLNENDSIALVSNILDCDKNFPGEKENVKTLVNILQYLPLALQQASAYIIDKKTYENNGYTIKTYLESFENCLLDPNLEVPFPDYFDNPYEKTVNKTIMMAIEKISYFPPAIDILSCIVYYNAEDIQINMFILLDDNLKPEDIDKAVRILKRYSIVREEKKLGWNENTFIKTEFGLLYIHRLVQQIWRKHLERTKKHTAYIQKALGLVIDIDWPHRNHLPTVLKYASETIILNCYINCFKSVEEEIVQFLASVECTINSISDLSSLHFPIFFNSQLILKDLIDKGAEVNSKTDEGLTPIHLAAICGANKAIQELINHNANVNMKTNQNQTALYFTALSDHWWAAQMLIEASAEVDVVYDGKTPLHIASERGYGWTIESLFAGKANINAKSRDGLTPLHLASIGGHDWAVQKLLRENADVGAITNEGRTALHLAAMKGFGWTVAEFVAKGFDVNARDNDNCTPAELATRFGQLKTAKLLELADELVKTGKEKCIWDEIRSRNNELIDKI